MRLWTLHPRYLDRQGLTALWREALLAQTVLRGGTVGYRHHPQLERFRAHADPQSAVNAYLAGIYEEAAARSYSFDRSKIGPRREAAPIAATTGQLAHEWQHLLAKLRKRSPALCERWERIDMPESHPLFEVVRGPVEPWERRYDEAQARRKRSKASASRRAGSGGAR